MYHDLFESIFPFYSEIELSDNKRPKLFQRRSRNSVRRDWIRARQIWRLCIVNFTLLCTSFVGIVCQYLYKYYRYLIRDSSTCYFCLLFSLLNHDLRRIMYMNFFFFFFCNLFFTNGDSQLFLVKKTKNKNTKKRIRFKIV